MAKPIFLVEVPNSSDRSIINETGDRLRNDMPDYHILVAMTDVKEIKFSAFYDKDLVETDFESFKAMVNQKLFRSS